MANEITVIQRRGRKIDLLFLIPIPAPAQVGTPPANVVVTPSEGVPDLILPALSAAEVAALDGGTMLFEVRTLVDPTGVSAGVLLARARAMYAVRKAEAQAEYASRFARTGQRFNEV